MRSAARTRAEAARGLAAVSVVGRRLAAAGQQPQDGPELGFGTGMPGGVRSTRAHGEGLLDDPVLERVEGDDGDPPAHGEGVDRGGQRALEDAELVVDLDAQRLEGPLRRVSPVRRVAAGIDVAHQFGKAAGPGERFPAALALDRRRDARGEPLLAVDAQHAGEVAGG